MEKKQQQSCTKRKPDWCGNEPI
jgi:hypothetical protein